MDKDLPVQVVVRSLIVCTGDNNADVIMAAKTSLLKIAKKYPNEILQLACDYQREHKLIAQQITVLIQIMAHISQEHIIELDGDVVLMLIEFCVEEMTKGTNPSKSVEMGSSDVLVALARKHCIQVMEGIMQKVVTGVVPHFAIIRTLGSLAMDNCYGTVPYIKSIMSNLLPIISLLKADYQKQAFAYALGSFGFAITEYVSNIDKVPDPTLTKETFYVEFAMAYDILLTSWLSSRETKVTESVLQALSSLILVLKPEKVAEQIPKIIPSLLGMYRRSVEKIYITKCICAVLTATPPENRSLLDVQLDDIVNHLVDQIVPDPDYVQPDSLKNHSEVLRCCDILISYFPFKIMKRLADQLYNNNEILKLKALIIVTHMMNTRDEALKDELKFIVVHVKHILSESKLKSKCMEGRANWLELNETSFLYRAKRILLKLVVLIAYHGFVDDDDIQLFLTYIIRLCCIQWDKLKVSDSENLERLEFKRVCDNSLYLLTTTAVNLESILWSVFLQRFVNIDYKEASCSIVRCLSHLAIKCKDSPDFLNDTTPNSSMVFVRCLALLTTPYDDYQGTYVLNFLKMFSLFINGRIVKVAELKIPQLLKYLENSIDNYDSDEWQNICLEFVSEAVVHTNDAKWTMCLIEELERHILLYPEFSHEKGFLLLCLAVALNHLQNATYVAAKIDSMLCLTRSSHDSEALVCSKMVKICTKTHLKPILLKLNDMWTNETAKKSSKLFSFLKDTRNESVERNKSAIMMCYTEIASTDDSVVAIQLWDLNILQSVVAHLKCSKDLDVRIIALKTISNIAENFNRNRNVVNRISCLEGRDDILYTVIDLLPESVVIHSQVLETARVLIKLPPVLKPAQKTKIFKTCFENIHSMVYVSLRFKMSKLTDLIDGNLVLLIKEILLQAVLPELLEEIFCLLQMWLTDRDPTQRLVALKMLKSVLSCYQENIGYDSTTIFELTGFIIGCLIPRCSDCFDDVRIEAVNCINLVLSIAAKYEGSLENSIFASTVIEHIQEKLRSPDLEIVTEAISDYATLISNKLPHFQLMSFIDSLLNGLLDVDSESAYGVSTVLNTFCKIKGGDMFHHVEDIIFKIIGTVERMNFADIKLHALRAITELASHHPKAVISSLLMQPLGYDTCVPECWHILGEDKILAAAAVNHFMRIISSTAVYDEQSSRECLRIAMHQPLAAISAISDMFCWKQMEEIAITEFAEIFSVLYISLASYIGVTAPVGIPQAKEKNKFSVMPSRNAYKLKPAKLALDAFKTFLLCAHCEQMTENLLLYNKIETDESISVFTDVVPDLVSSLCVKMNHLIPKILTNLTNYRTSSYAPQRVAVYAFYCEYVHQETNTSVILLESTVAGLLEGQADSNGTVRQLSLKGLGYLAYHNDKLLARHSTTILNAFLNGLDEQTMSNASMNNIPLASLIGISKILPTMDDEMLIGVQVNIGMRVKPFFDNEDPLLRSAAINLFEKLVTSAKSSNSIREQINSNLIYLLLHVSDHNAEVVKACKSALRTIAPVLKAKKVNSMIQDHLLNDAKLNYSTFITAMVKLMAEELLEIFPYLIMSALAYVKSRSELIRGNTALIIGLLYSHLPENSETQKILDTVSSRLVQLLKDNDTTVRSKTASALSSLIST